MEERSLCVYRLREGDPLPAGSEAVSERCWVHMQERSLCVYRLREGDALPPGSEAVAERTVNSAWMCDLSLTEMCSSSHTAVWVAVLGSGADVEAVGALEATALDDSRGAEVEAIVVHPGHRRRGIGRALVKAARDAHGGRQLRAQPLHSAQALSFWAAMRREGTAVATTDT
ncbi:Hypothetical protein UVM_LOCUS384 [uncultured virus]|nr:Hypothetical protein UVM_LOCUS384 [uncultured virus]